MKKVKILNEHGINSVAVFHQWLTVNGGVNGIVETRGGYIKSVPINDLKFIDEQDLIDYDNLRFSLRDVVEWSIKTMSKNLKIEYDSSIDGIGISIMPEYRRSLGYYEKIEIQGISTWIDDVFKNFNILLEEASTDLDNKLHRKSFVKREEQTE